MEASCAKIIDSFCGLKGQGLMRELLGRVVEENTGWLWRFIGDLHSV